LIPLIPWKSLGKSAGIIRPILEDGGKISLSRVGLPEINLTKLPTALDMPKIRTIFINTNDPEGPFGAKECGEGSTAPVAPSIANAVYNALGVRFHDLPITPEKVLKAIKKNSLGRQESF